MAKNKKSVKKGLIIGISSVVVLLAAAYAGVGYYFHDHFYPGTVINETNFSLGTADTAAGRLPCRKTSPHTDKSNWSGHAAAG